MATVDTTVNNLVINKLTQAQYDALTEKSPTELYFVTDAQEPLQVVDAVENFPACTVEDLGKLVIYTGPTTESTQESVQLVLDGTIYNGHIFGCIEVTLTTENGDVAYYMWKDVYESLPKIGDSVAGKVLSNDGLYPEWVDMPEGDKLPDQTDNAGKFLMTDGTTASWGNALENKDSSIGKNAFVITKSNSFSGIGNLSVAFYGGSGWVETGERAVALGAGVAGDYSVSIIGTAHAHRAVQLGDGTNADDNTFKVGNTNGNFEMMSADGTIPTDRYTTTPTNAGTYVPKLTIAEDGTATREWGTESSGSGSSSQVNELPDASLNVGNVVQYVGESTDTLTNGYFYKAEQVDPLTAEITNFDSYAFSTPPSVEVGDSNLFVEKFGDAYGTYILTVDDMFTFVLQKPDGTRNGSAPISYGINITIDGELQTTYNAPLAAASGNLEITIVYNASGGFVWKSIDVQKVDIKKELPSLSSGADKFLMTDGVDLYWYDAVTPSDYAMKSKAGLIRPSSTYGTTMTGVQYLAAEVKTPAQYEAANNQMFISKGTLDNVLESYMLVPTSPADNGTYVLKATVVDGVVTTEWVLEA